MARFVKGDIVVVPFPFSDLTQAKRRPALVLIGFEEDLILCQITSQQVRDNHAITIEDSDYESGSLKQSSNVRPNRLFTASEQIVLYRAGQLKSEKTNQVAEKIIQLLRS